MYVPKNIWKKRSGKYHRKKFPASEITSTVFPNPPFNTMDENVVVSPYEIDMEFRIPQKAATNRNRK